MYELNNNNKRRTVVACLTTKNSYSTKCTCMFKDKDDEIFTETIKVIVDPTRKIIYIFTC